MISTDLLLNKKNWKCLIHSWRGDKLPHALLFQGPAGSGKEGHALELAGLLNCTASEIMNPAEPVHPAKRRNHFNMEV